MSELGQDRKSLFDHIVGTPEKRCWEINVKRVDAFHVYGRSNWLALVPTLLGFGIRWAFRADFHGLAAALHCWSCRI